MTKLSVLSVRLETLNGVCNHESTMRTHGRHGSSALNANGCRRNLTKFEESLKNDCKTYAKLASLITTNQMNSENLAAYNACRFKVPHKTPEFMPFVVGRVLIKKSFEEAL